MHCGVCGSSPARVQTRLQVVLCDRCALARAEPEPTEPAPGPTITLREPAEDLAELLEDEAVERLATEE